MKPLIMKILVALAAIVLSIAAVTGIKVWQAQSNLNAASANITPRVHERLGDTLMTTDGLTVQLDRIQKNGPRWLVHFVVKNTASHTLEVIGATNIHQFFAVNSSIQGSSGMRQFSVPASTELSSYPALQAALNANQSGTGWMAVDIAGMPLAPDAIVYHYGVTQTQSCTDIHNPATCHPADLYEDLIWQI
jgi:hypothetical protein